jgi:hypothetical protein
MLRLEKLSPISRVIFRSRAIKWNLKTGPEKIAAHGHKEACINNRRSGGGGWKHNRIGVCRSLSLFCSLVRERETTFLRHNNERKLIFHFRPLTFPFVLLLSLLFQVIKINVREIYGWGAVRNGKWEWTMQLLSGAGDFVYSVRNLVSL